jgi:outer membrane protein assembly factor BamB
MPRVMALLLASASGVAGCQSIGVVSNERGAGHAGPRAGDDATASADSEDAASPESPDATIPGPINEAFPGLTTFRGNATRDYYGEGPVPTNPEVKWRYPIDGGLCSESEDADGVQTWCGTGWTGQPNVIEHADGTVEVRIGAFDAHYHFLNGRTGKPMRPDLVTGDLAKGSATSDPDGYPLYYAGSRDNFLRVVALDRGEPTVLWQLDANANPEQVWNDDWDGAPLVIGDYLLEGGENSWFYVIKLNRSFDNQHQVQVDPEVVLQVPGYDDQLLQDLGDDDVSIENSVAYDRETGVAYFANSGGLVQGWDLRDVLDGGTKAERVFRFWDGDETDASIVIDPEGYLYVARHASVNVPTRPQTRDQEVGSLMKLDPRHPGDPLVWSRQIGGFEPDGGILSTPALYGGTVFVMDTAGSLVGVSEKTGKVRYRVPLPGPTWGSPVPIDGNLLIGDCDGVLHDFDIRNPSRPPEERWRVQLEGCIESTPAVWRGMIYVGARGGAIYGIGDR